MNDLIGNKIQVTGIVQGVGFRPFVYNLARRYSLNGWVRNTSAGVEIRVDGQASQLEAFLHALRIEAPPLASIDTFTVQSTPPAGFHEFSITQSQDVEDAFQPISPDIGVCADCLAELFDPHDRRYQYPFINCTNCGPRFTIITDIPYDRPKTSMAGFQLCTECNQEYHDPTDRRFHAQPVACPRCGPQVWLEQNSPGFNVTNVIEQSLDQMPASPDMIIGVSAIQAAQELLAAGKILAIKGLGGFHLACDAANPAAVAELRRRKLRVDKPFALMFKDLTEVRTHCHLSPSEAELLGSHAKPVVILDRLEDANIAREVSPEQDTIGAILPYTPLHHLLFAKLQNGSRTINADTANLPVPALVMTSGNLSEEPIATGNVEARKRLSSLADAFLMHNRPIYMRCDDSVMRVYKPHLEISPLRRSRGYAPYPVRLPWEAPPVLAAGAELKNTFCVTRGQYAFLSQHIGDMENYETLASYEASVAHYEQLFRIKPALIVYDLHPDYLASRYALERGEREEISLIGVQHHHAHIAACMAEHGFNGDEGVIGIAFDGTGYGADGHIWGGEILLADYMGYERFAHLAYTPLPGGDRAVRKPARTALAYLWKASVEWDLDLSCVSALCADERAAIRTQLEHQVNSPLTSSMGRLFDALAAIAGVRQEVNYEAQAAIELEACALRQERSAYSFEIVKNIYNKQEPSAVPYMLEPNRLIRDAVEDARQGVPAGMIAARFHNAVTRMVLDVTQLASAHSRLRTVALSGGVWQNMLLLEKTTLLLEEAGFTVLRHRRSPANDGGLSLGQAVIGARHLMIT